MYQPLLLLTVVVIDCPPYGAEQALNPFKIVALVAVVVELGAEGIVMVLLVLPVTRP
jgi:hypothetical protein